MGVRGDMEPRGSLHRTGNGESPVVYNAQIYDAPLLPYEKQLIATIGATEEEYRILVKHAFLSGIRKPAGYEHIPDIRCDPGTIAIAGITLFEAGALTFAGQIVVGAILLTAGYLLTPKPKELDQRGPRNLASLNQAGRYSPTYGFESQAELVDYQAPIPLVFANAYYDGDQYKSGGVLVSPRLVWSRMLSLGSQQAAKLLLVVGEQGVKDKGGIDLPDLTGIFIGNGALDSLYKSSFSFYWKNGDLNDTPRIREYDEKYGEARGSLDPNSGVDDDVFSCSTHASEYDTGFCSVHSLSNHEAFGCFAPINNGTPYRVNWRTVPIPHISDGQDDDPEKVNGFTRWKIAGDKMGGPGSPRQNMRGHSLREADKGQWGGFSYWRTKTQDVGMPGIGRNYPCRMGIIEYYKKSVSPEQRLRSTTDGNPNSPWIPMKEFSGVKRGDRCLFQIRPGTEKLREDLYADGKVKVEDINNKVDEMRIAADDALQIGELFIIGGCTWRVLSRTVNLWTVETAVDQNIILECIDASEPPFDQIGLVARTLIIPTVAGIAATKRRDGTDRPAWSNHHPGYGSAGSPASGYGAKDGDGFIGDTPEFGDIPGGSWYPLMRIAKGMVRNKRPCDRTEIGIKSNVFQQFTGLCNFNSLLSVRELYDAEHSDPGVVVNSGTMNAYASRSSCFVIRYRVADGSWYNENPAYPDLAGWKRFHPVFVVIGTSPVIQYNSIRIDHPNRGEGDDTTYEFQLLPVNGAALRTFPNDAIFYRLTAGRGGFTDDIKDISVEDGFKLRFKGSRVTRAAIRFNKEFSNNAAVTQVTESVDKEMSLERAGKLPVNFDVPNISLLSNVRYKKNIGEGRDANKGAWGAWSWEMFGTAGPSDPRRKSVFKKLYTDGTTFHAEPAGNYISGRPLSFTFDLIKVDLGAGHWSGESAVWWVEIIGDNSTYGTKNGYRPDHAGDDNVNTDFAQGETIKILKDISGSNPWKSRSGMNDFTKVGIELDVIGVSHVSRSRGLGYGIPYEIFGSADNFSPGDEKTVDILMQASMAAGQDTNGLEDGRKIKVRMRSRVLDIADKNWTGRDKTFDAPYQIEALIDDSDSTGGWETGDIFEYLLQPGNGHQGGGSKTNNPFRSDNSVWIGYKFRVSHYDETTNVVSVELDPAQQAESARLWEHNSQLSDISFYHGHVQKSNSDNSEHVITYVNESMRNLNHKGEAIVPNYDHLTMAGLIFKASRNYSILDQIRVWLAKGMKVKRWHPDRSAAYRDSEEYGASNLFPDLVYHLLTDRISGTGQILGTSVDAATRLIDTDSFQTTCKFLHQNKLFFDGSIAGEVNVRQYVNDLAPNFLCQSVIKNGLFALVPAIPTTAEGDISLGIVPIQQIFTDGNILEGSYETTYLNLEERQPFKAMVRYRKERKNKLPEEDIVEVQWKGYDGADVSTLGSFSNEEVVIENFNLTDFCTRREHAVAVGKYFIAIRRLITHTISFQTTPYGLDLAPGDYIKVSTAISPYSSINNGTIDADGDITSVNTLPDGTYNVLYYPTGSLEEVQTGQLIVDGKKTNQSQFFNSIFSIEKSTNSLDVYKVEQITLEEDRTVSIVASEFPCNGDGVSHIAWQIHPDKEADFWTVS